MSQKQICVLSILVDELVVNCSHSNVHISDIDKNSDTDLGCGDHADVYSDISKSLEHLRSVVGRALE